MCSKLVCTGSFVVDIFTNPVKTANESSLTKIFTYLGGNAFNVVKDLVNLNYSNDTITCIGAVGDDIFGRLFASELKNIGVKGELYTVHNVTTSKIFMLKVKSEATRYFFDEGANAFLPSNVITATLENSKPAIFYTGETGNLKSIIPNFQYIMETAKLLDCITIVDTVIPPNKDWSFYHKSKQFIDILKCNEYEALSLTNSNDVNEASHKLLESGIPLVVISCADKGALYSWYSSIYKIPAFTVKCVDSTGAGDAFNAGLIKYIGNLNGKTLSDRINREDTILSEIMIYASACGASAVTKNGCYDGVSDNNVSQLMIDQGDRIKNGIEKIK